MTKTSRISVFDLPARLHAIAQQVGDGKNVSPAQVKKAVQRAIADPAVYRDDMEAFHDLQALARLLRVESPPEFTVLSTAHTGTADPRLVGPRIDAIVRRLERQAADEGLTVYEKTLVAVRDLLEKLCHVLPSAEVLSIFEIELRKGAHIDRHFFEVDEEDPQVACRRGRSPCAYVDRLSTFTEVFGQLDAASLGRIMRAAEFDLVDVFKGGGDLSRPGAPWIPLMIASWLDGPHGSISTAAELRAVIESMDFTGWDFVNVADMCGAIAGDLFERLAKERIFVAKVGGQADGIGHAFNAFLPANGAPTVYADGAAFQFIPYPGMTDRVIVGDADDFAKMAKECPATLTDPSGKTPMSPALLRQLYNAGAPMRGFQGDRDNHLRAEIGRIGKRLQKLGSR